MTAFDLMYDALKHAIVEMTICEKAAKNQAARKRIYKRLEMAREALDAANRERGIEPC